LDVDRASPHEALALTWLADLASAHTRDAYGRDFGAFVVWCVSTGRAPLGVSAADVDDYRDDCRERGVRPATVARRLSALSSFYDHAVHAQAVEANPVDTVKRPAVGDARARSGLPEDEALAMLDAAAEMGPKVAALVALLLLEGLKLGEALALDVEQLDGSRWTMYVSVLRRGRTERFELDRQTASCITAHLAGRTSGPLLVGDSPTQDGRTRLTRFGADFLLKRTADRAGLKRPVSANTLRHTYIELSHRDGVPVEQIARRVGHASARDTRRYLP
jgi:site-specific recombinase XerD